MGMAYVAQAQIFCDEACFYAQAGSSQASTVVCFEGTKGRVWVKKRYYSEYAIKSKLIESPNYFEEKEKWENNVNGAHVYEYDNKRSSEFKTVYKREIINRKTYQWDPLSHTWLLEVTGWGYNPYAQKKCIEEHVGWDYVIFSADKTAFESYEEKDGSISNQDYYTIVHKTDLLPKSASNEFYND